MLSHPELMSLRHALRDDDVLSVYIEGEGSNAAMRRSWRVKVEQMVRDQRRRLMTGSHHEREAFERCVSRLERALAPLRESMATPGWTAFITAGAVHLAESLPVSVPTMVTWRKGLCVAPYIRALKQCRPATVVMADARSARISWYHLSELTPVRTVAAPVRPDTPIHMGDAPRDGFHTGVRGRTAHDAAARAMQESSDRMIDRAVILAGRLAGREGWLLIGGSPEVSQRMATLLQEVAPGRVRMLEPLDAHVTGDVLVAAVRRVVSDLRDAHDLSLLDQIVQRSAAEGPGSVGADETSRAIAQGRVDTLFFTRHYLEEHPAEAEDLVRAALDQGAEVEEVSREAAERLDALGGVAARLRYRWREHVGAVAPAVL